MNESDPRVKAFVERGAAEGRLVDKTPNRARAQLDFPPPLACEEDLSRAVKGLAAANGWFAYHARDSRKSEPGFPDWLLLRDILIVAELKFGRNRQTAAQREWLSRFRKAGVPAYLWYATDWAEIVGVLCAPPGGLPRAQLRSGPGVR